MTHRRIRRLRVGLFHNTLGWAVQAASVHMSSPLPRSSPGGKARPGKFNYGVIMGVGGGGGESSGYGGLEANRSLFRPDVEYPLEMSVVGGTRGHQSLITDNYPNDELSDSRDTVPLLGFLSWGGWKWNMWIRSGWRSKVLHVIYG